LIYLRNQRPDNPVQVERRFKVFIVTDVQLRFILPDRLTSNRVMFAGGVVLDVEPHLYVGHFMCASLTGALAGFLRIAGRNRLIIRVNCLEINFLVATFYRRDLHAVPILSEKHQQ